MDNRTWNIACRKILSLGRDDNGAVLVITLAIFFFLFMLVSGVYAVGEAIHHRIELQNACDAAAYSAAVVQADGLSRMATVNRAMAWTYVQMVKRQMDYITYRWLKLTYKQFKEDRDNAEDWFFHLLPCDEDHDEDGVGWWCGQGPKGGMDKIRLNYRYNVKKDDLKKLLDKLESSMGDDNSEDSASSFTGNKSDGNMLGDENSLFGVNSLNPVKNEAYQKIQEQSASGNPPGPAEIEQIYKDIFTRSHPEPPKYTTDPVSGKQVVNPDWTMWDLQFRNFTEMNKITMGDYCCKICNKPMAGFSHSNCIQNQMNSAAQSQQQSQPQSSSSSGSSKYKWGSKLGAQIKDDKKAIETMNLALDAININMTMAMKAAAKQVLEYNLPHDKDGEISEDFLYTLHVPMGSNPYGAAESGDASLAGIFSPLYNTEEYETLFLNMMDGEVYDSLLQYYTGGKASAGFLEMLSGSSGAKAGGLDQWFIRTYPAETMNSNEKNIKPTAQSYYAEGISRSYKNANRKEGSCITGQSRANHTLSVGDNNGIGGGSDMFGIGELFSSIMDSLKQTLDFSPSCINRRGRFPEMCRKIDNSVGLVSQYRWCTAKWFCFFTVYLFGIEWHHPFIPKFWCGDHGYGFIWVADELKALFGGMTRNDYRNCFIGFDDAFIFKGHARIYGDDRDLVNEQYTGVPARPWILNEKFFAGDGTITVGLARRQRNPWQRVLSWFNGYDSKSPNVSSGLLSLFNVNPSNYMWTVSTARAAYRRRTDGVYGSDGDDGGGGLWDTNMVMQATQTISQLKGHGGGGSSGGTSNWHSSHTMGYDVKFDGSAWPDALEIDYASGASGDLKKLRVGCVCDKGDNKQRLEQAWNLGTPDWDATLLPVRFAKGYGAKYESWKESGGIWSGGSGEGQGAFSILGGLTWNGLGDHSSSSMPGSEVMNIINQDGKSLGSLQELEKLKIY